MAEMLVARMKERSVNNGGKYISVHLRFEEVGFNVWEFVITVISK